MCWSSLSYLLILVLQVFLSIIVIVKSADVLNEASETKLKEVHGALFLCLCMYGIFIQPFFVKQLYSMTSKKTKSSVGSAKTDKTTSYDPQSPTNNDQNQSMFEHHTENSSSDFDWYSRRSSKRQSQGGD